MEKNRMEAFTDGVFAIVITLLVLEIRVPHGTSAEQLGESLLELLPNILAYMLSFSLVGLYWLVHHRNMTLVKKINHRLLWINLVWMLFVSFIPFPTSLLGEYPFEPLPIVIYGANLVCANMIGIVSMIHLKRHPELAHVPIKGAYVRYLIPRYIWVNALYLLAIGLAWVAPIASYLIFLFVLVNLIYNYATESRAPLGEKSEKKE